MADEKTTTDNEAASEPVPVNPTVPNVSPQLAFTIGKQLGRRIFR